VHLRSLLYLATCADFANAQWVATINSRETLEAWFQGKLSGCGAAIAHRAALRVLPIVPDLPGFENSPKYAALASASFRVNAISRLAIGYPIHEIAIISNAVHTAGAAAYAAFDRGYGGGGRNPGIALDAASRAAGAVHAAISADIENETPAAVSATAEAVRTVDRVTSAFGGDSDAACATMWTSIQSDCDVTEAGFLPNELLELPLWSGSVPGWIEPYITTMENGLRTLDQGFDNWIDWYRRRIAGDACGFGLAGGTEHELSIRLIEATDRWWKREPAIVNRDIQRWIDELTPLKTATFDGIEPEPQSSLSPQFKTDSDGRIAIDATANADQLRDDREAMSRYAAARGLAEMLRSTLRGHNNAGYIADQADEYLEALGQDFSDIEPSMVVLHGERLRQSVAAHQNAGPNDNLQPLPEVASRDAGGLLVAHNMLVGLDPYLNQLDRAVLGPDIAEPMVTPAEVRTVAQETSDQGVLAPETKAIMDEAADLAPARPDLVNRNSRFLSGLAQNFARYGIEFLSTYPTEAAWVSALGGVAALATVGVVLTVGTTVSGIGLAYALGRNILANEAVYRKMAGSSPASAANMYRLIAFLKTLPLNAPKEG
jgi:hypothetical protein